MDTSIVVKVFISGDILWLQQRAITTYQQCQTRQVRLLFFSFIPIIPPDMSTCSTVMHYYASALPRLELEIDVLHLVMLKDFPLGITICHTFTFATKEIFF